MDITLRMSAETYAVFQAIGRFLCLSTDEIVLNALRTYISIKRLQAAGKRVYIGNDACIEGELIIP